MRLKMLILFLITTLCGICLRAPARVVIYDVNIPDPKLLAAINKTLNRPSDAPIDAEEILDLTKLHAEDISSLTGLGHASLLVELSLVGRRLTREEAGGYKVLSEELSTRTFANGLPVLYEDPLHFLADRFVPVVDVAPPAEHWTHLTTLTFKHLHLVDAAPLSDLKTLTALTLVNAHLSDEDLAPLSALPHLSKLDLSVNVIISDISPLSVLTHLTDLSLATNAISDISPLSALTHLTTLNLNDNEITDISALAGLTHLQTLSLKNNNIRDISALAGLTRLTHLEIGNDILLFANMNRIVDISPLAALTELESLSLGNTALTDVSTLAGLPNLVYLDLAHHIELDLYGDTRLDLAPLTVLTDLEVLDLRHIPLTADALKHISTLAANGTDVRFTPPRDDPKK